MTFFNVVEFEGLVIGAAEPNISKLKVKRAKPLSTTLDIESDCLVNQDNYPKHNLIAAL